VQPSEFESIKVGPLWRPSTETLSKHPSASIIGISISPLVMRWPDPRIHLKKESIHEDGLSGQVRQ
jgi:hypothetical protein